MTSKLTITRERLQEIAEDGFLKHGESKELARIALAAIDSEPVAWTWQHLKQWHVTNDEERARDLAWDGVKVEPLYRRAAMPQAGTLTNEGTKQAWTGIPDIDNAINMLDRIDTLESCDDDRIEAVKTVLRRLAGNSPVIPDGMLKIGYMFITAEGGTAFSISDVPVPGMTLAGPVYAPAVKAGGQQNAPQNIPEIIPDGWIPVSEHLPKEKGVYQVWNGKYVDNVPFWFGSFQSLHSELITHWMPLPAAPQEVK